MGSVWHGYQLPSDCHNRQGDNFQLEVIDKLTDKSLDLVTSIVRNLFFYMWFRISIRFVCSIGMASSRRQLTTLMVLRLSLSVQLYHGDTSCTTLQSRIKWYFLLFSPRDMDKPLNSSPISGDVLVSQSLQEPIL